MSTVLEAIAARAEGLELLGISLVTNAAAGLGGENLDHHDVLAAGAAAANRMSCLTPRQAAAVVGAAEPITEAAPHTAPVPQVRREGEPR